MTECVTSSSSSFHSIFSHHQQPLPLLFSFPSWPTLPPPNKPPTISPLPSCDQRRGPLLFCFHLFHLPQRLSSPPFHHFSPNRLIVQESTGILFSPFILPFLSLTPSFYFPSYSFGSADVQAMTSQSLRPFHASHLLSLTTLWDDQLCLHDEPRYDGDPWFLPR